MARVAAPIGTPGQFRHAGRSLLLAASTVPQMERVHHRMRHLSSPIVAIVYGASDFDICCMLKRTSITLCITLSALLSSPGLATACTIGFRTIGPVEVQRADVVRPVQHRVKRRSWPLDKTWTSTVPELNQVIVSRSGHTYLNATFGGQDTLSIDAAAPSDNGSVYMDDESVATPACTLSGQGEWQLPVVLMREDRHTIKIIAAARRTTGDRTGCTLGIGPDGRGCPTLTRTIMKLQRPIGQRQLVFERFS